MNKDMQGLAMGVAAAVLAYAVYARFKAPAGPAGQGARIAPARPAGGAVYNPNSPGVYLSTDELIYGSATGTPWDSYTSTDDLINGVVYGGKVPLGPRVPGAYW